MQGESKSIEDIKAIRKIMEESSRFLSLSGLSGVLAGVTAIAGALVAWFFVLDNGSIRLDEFYNGISEKSTVTLRWQLFALAAAVLVIAMVNAFIFSTVKAKKAGRKFWTPVSKRMLINLFVPLIAGGVFILALIAEDNLRLMVPSFLIFYGLALVSAGKFTFGEIFYLGILEIVTGLVAAFVPGLDLVFWIFGFGFLHIVYGLLMYRKYEA